ncbi:unnamed protein product [Ceutorhynchus assimilis]|uniref:Uncharacterized protein n=1 Tax=Ceutorhynchus assimilis TaxID=467358 RepID=A0A9N9MQZ6_9CUCU|nr:unnamed protein product [Ceutorhynchus assimilis]
MATTNYSSKDIGEGLRDFVSKIKPHNNALEASNVQIFKNWDLILVNIFSSKLDKFLRNEFELGRDQNVLPTLEELLEFLNKKISAWEISEQNVDKNKGLENRVKYEEENVESVHNLLHENRNNNGSYNLNNISSRGGENEQVNSNSVPQSEGNVEQVTNYTTNNIEHNVELEGLTS